MPTGESISLSSSVLDVLAAPSSDKGGLPGPPVSFAPSVSFNDLLCSRRRALACQRRSSSSASWITKAAHCHQQRQARRKVAVALPTLFPLLFVCRIPCTKQAFDVDVFPVLDPLDDALQKSDFCISSAAEIGEFVLLRDHVYGIGSNEKKDNDVERSRVPWSRRRSLVAAIRLTGPFHEFGDHGQP